ncbi:hypothetical protein PLICBS_007422 [Purpureocillium lilacinum]|uniref:uncharacterized protein n=1 Tax=Purpureocillium lilacinum TaxID=33203 RepID=UPI002082D186|nr:hypothetical protein PLICBS_007422 [Purpureocillium lilacinum]
MALRHKRGVSPLRRDEYPPTATIATTASMTPTYARPRSNAIADAHAPPQQPPQSSIGYVLEWTSGPMHTRPRRHALCGVEDLRTELLAGRDGGGGGGGGGGAPGSGRMLIPILFIDDRAAYTSPSPAVAVPPGNLTGPVPGPPPARPAPKLRHQDAATTGSRLGKQPSGGRYGATGTSPPASTAAMMPPTSAGPRTGDGTGSKRRRREASPRPPWAGAATTGGALSFDEELWDALELMGGSAGSAGDVSVEELVGELVYERWAAWLVGRRRLRHNSGATSSSSTPSSLSGAALPSPSPSALWAAMAALEQNLDEARHLARQGGRVLDAASPSAWGDLLQRAQARVHLAQISPPVSSPPSSTIAAAAGGILAPPLQRRHQTADKQPPAPLPPPACDPELFDERSLDRIAYLGGLLLPVTVVAGVLSIEGDYGPEGTNFWVFWVASLAASAAALLVIYADQLRSLEVWWLELPPDAEGGKAQQQGRDDYEGDDEDEHGAGHGVRRYYQAEAVAFEGGGGGTGGGGGEGRVVRPAARYLVQRGGEAAQRTWRRGGRLGWGGAVKTMSGYYRWKGDARVRIGRPGEALREAWAPPA